MNYEAHIKPIPPAGQTPEPGIYLDVPFETYCGWNCVNNSLLSRVNVSPAHGLAYAQGQGKEPTPALRLGTLVHTGQFEPETLMQRYFVLEVDLDRIRTKDGSKSKSPKATAMYADLVQEQLELHAGKTALEPKDWDAMARMLTAIAANDRARGWFEAPGYCEACCVAEDPETGLLLKSRMDKWVPQAKLIADLKTSARIERFARDILNYSYHRQGAFYPHVLASLLGFDADEITFGLVAIESAEPHCVLAAPLDRGLLAQAQAEVRELLRTWHECLTTGVYPGPEQPAAWGEPEESPADIIRSLTFAD